MELELWDSGFGKSGISGTLELWNSGTLERWNSGTLELWNWNSGAGILEELWNWNPGTRIPELEPRNLNQGLHLRNWTSGTGPLQLGLCESTSGTAPLELEFLDLGILELEP